MDVLRPPQFSLPSPASIADGQEDLPDDFDWEGWYNIADTRVEPPPEPPLPTGLLTTWLPLPPEEEGSEEEKSTTDPGSSSHTYVGSGSDGQVPLLPTETDYDCWWQRTRNQVAVLRW